MNSTKDYKMFKYMTDNRPIDKGHVNRLIASIKSRNLLEYTPIIVDKTFNVIDGQHRLEAAKALGVPIYYKVQESNDAADIIHLNIAKSWNIIDFFNFFVKHKYPEYVKLDAFCKKNALSIKLGIFLFLKRTKNLMHDFKCGKFVFEEKVGSDTVNISIAAIDVLKKYLGVGKVGFDSKKLWKAIYVLASNPEFDMEIWKRNVGMLCEKIHSKATEEDMLNHILWVYNYRNQNKIEVGEDHG